MIQDVKFKGLLALAALTAGVVFLSSHINRGSGLVVHGIVLGTGLQSMAVFWALLWALPRSNQAFFSVFVGDALLRLTSLGLLSWWLSFNHLSFAAPLVTLALASLAFSLLQVPFFYRVR